MYLRKDVTGSEPTFSPALATTVAVAVFATLLLGVYPREAFEFAQASAEAVGLASATAAIFR
jgi:hypothetical protein